MASVNKKFGIEKGLEVGTDALVVDADNNRTGVIAQEVEKLELPGLTTTRKDNGTKAGRYERLIPLLIEAIKELKGEVDELKRTK